VRGWPGRDFENGRILNTDTWLLVYDDACGLCRKFAALAQKWDVRGKLKEVGFSDPRIRSYAPGLSLEKLRESFHLILPQGQVFTGAEAVPYLFRLLPGGGPFAWLLENMPGSRWILGRLLSVITSIKSHDS